MKTIKLNDKNLNFLTFLGRYFQTKDGMVFDYSGSGVSFDFVGESFSFEFSPRNISNDDSIPYIVVIVDGKKLNKICVDEENMSFVHHFSSASLHHIEIIKITECLISQVVIHCLSIDGTFSKQEKKLAIEIYGDSLTCAYGVESLDPNAEFHSKDENYTCSYAYLIQKELNANVSAICASGYPLLKAIYSHDSRVDNIPDCFSLANLPNKVDEPIAWDNKKFAPNIVVINLGANDSTLGEKSLLKEAYITKLHHFLDLLFKNYGEKLKVIFFHGMVSLPAFIVNATKEGISSYERKIYVCETTSRNEGEFVATGHPNKAMHKKAAKDLAKFIKGII